MVTSNVINGLIDNSKNDGNISSTTKNDKSNSSLDVNDFLQLLVAQMQYQDPLEPTDNTQYIAQMATFTQVEATTEMGNKVEQQMASSLVGKSVIMKTNESSSGMIAGKVNYWENIDGKIYLGINGKLYDIADVDTDRFFLDRREEFRGSEARGIQGIERKTGLLWKLRLDRMCLDPLRALPGPFGQGFTRLVVHGRNHREVKMNHYLLRKICIHLNFSSVQLRRAAEKPLSRWDYCVR